MFKTSISLAAAAAMALPVMGHAMILDEAIVAQILGTRMPPSEVRVGTVMKPNYNSVHFFDNLINLTNRVLDRSIRADIVAQQTNSQNGMYYVQAARHSHQALKQHCIVRLMADGIANPAGKCGNGLIR